MNGQKSYNRDYVVCLKPRSVIKKKNETIHASTEAMLLVLKTCIALNFNSPAKELLC